MVSRIRVLLRGAVVAAVTLSLVHMAFPGNAAAMTPALPQASVDTTMPSVTGQSITLPAGGNLQSAIDNARLGDEIVLQAGATYGAITLRNKSGSGWLVIRSSAAGQLPAGTRVGPGNAGQMARIVGGAGSAAAVQTDAGAHHYRFIGIEFTTSSGAYSTGLVRLGTGSETSLGQLPHSLVIDRCYIHGDAGAGGRRGIALNSGATAIIDSYISDWKGVGEDTQAIAGWNGSGPYKIINNYLEGAAENILFGGSDPLISNLIPSDIEIRRNHFFKPVAWRSQSWSVKNLFELKNAQRVLIDGNVFENNWAAAQNGTAVLFSVRNQDGGAPWTVLQDITFTNNTVKHVAAGLKITGFDDTGFVTQQTKRVLIKNNVFDDVNHNTWGGDGRMFLFLHGPDSVTIDHNTGMTTGAFVISDNVQQFTNFVFTNNIATRGIYGVKGDSNSEGLGTLTNLFSGYVFSRIALIGASQSIYPPDNFFPTSVSGVQFVDYASGNYRLVAGSQYANAATDGTALGANMDALQAAQAGSGSSSGGSSTPPPPPPPPPTPSAPSLSFMNPASGATVTGAVTVSLTATGGSGGGYNYTVKAGTATIYSGTNASFSWNTTATPNGAVTLAATVTDSAGGGASASRGVTVSNTISGGTTTGGTGSTDTTPPAVRMTAPNSGAWTGNSIVLSASATDDVALSKIEFWGNNRKIGTASCSGTSCSGSVGWVTAPLAKAAYIVNAVAYDRAGNRTTSAPITINKDDTSPLVASGAPSSSTVTAPTSTPTGTTTAGTTTAGTTTAGTTTGGTTTGGTTTGGTTTGGTTTGGTTTGGTTTGGTTTGGTTTGGTTTGGTTSGGTGSPDTTPPAVTMTAPNSGVWTGNSIVLSASATDNAALSRIEFWGNNGKLGSVSCSGTSCSGSYGWITGALPPAAYEVKAIAVDVAENRTVSAGIIINKDGTSPLVASGATGGTTSTTSTTSGSTTTSSTATVASPTTSTITSTTSDTTAPTVRITSPFNGDWTGNSIAVSATASDNVSVKAIDFYGDGVLLGTINCSTATCSGTVGWLTGPLPNGTHLISAVARDAAGNASTSPTVTIFK